MTAEAYPPHACKACGETLVRRERERPGKFQQRRFCNHACFIADQVVQRAPHPLNLDLIDRVLDGVPGAIGIPLFASGGTVRTFAFVDREDAEWVNQRRWHATYGYAVRSVPGGTVPMHREILGLSPGDPIHVDHINGNGLDNRRANLRRATHAQNMQNRHGAVFGTTSTYRGVNWVAKKRQWAAYGSVGGKTIYLGLFKVEEDAAAAAASFRAQHMPFSSDAR